MIKLKIALTILFVLVAVALTIIVLSQEGKDHLHHAYLEKISCDRAG